jgi:hypothetical protein
MKRAMAIAAGGIATISALHAEEPPGGWFNERTVSGIHDVTVLLAVRYEPKPPPCPLQEPIVEPGRIALRGPCTPLKAIAPYDRGLWPLWAQHLRRQVGDPGRH